MLTGAILYGRFVNEGHCGVVPLMVPGVAGIAGLTVTAKLFALLVPQLLLAVTVISPFCPAVPEVTDTAVVPAPAVTDQPVGTVHV